MLDICAAILLVAVCVTAASNHDFIKVTVCTALIC